MILPCSLFCSLVERTLEEVFCGGSIANQQGIESITIPVETVSYVN